MIKKQKNSQLESRRTILLIVEILFFIAFLPIVNAADWDNVLDYKNDDKTVIITNWLGLGEKLGNATLSSHESPTEIRGVIAGKNRTVMYYEFDFKNNYGGGLGDVKFINMKNGEIILKDYYFAEAVWSEINVITEFDSKTNLTIKEEKKNIISDWNKLNSNDILSGKRTIGLVTDVNHGDEIDGQWKIAGKYVKRHAVWSEGLNNNLRSYYTFNETAYPMVDLVSSINGTDIGGTPLHAQSGIINGSHRLGSLNFTTSSLDWGVLANREYSFNFWFKRINSAAGDQMLVRDASNQIQLQTINSTHMKWIPSNADGQPPFEITSNVFTMLTVVSNTTFVGAYTNGVLRSSSNSVAGTGGGKTSLINQLTVDNEWIDEFGVWNRTLTPSEITDLYNGGTGITYFSTENLNPSVTLNSPADASTTSTQNVLFSCSATAFTGNTIRNISLWTNHTGTWGQRNITTGLTLNAETVTFNNTFTSDDTFIWNCLAYDNLNNFNYAANNFTLTIDSLAPTNVLDAPRGTLNFGQIGREEYINWTITGATTCWFTYNGINTTRPCTDNNATFILLNNIYNITLWANDSVNNLARNTSNWLYYVVQINESFANETTEGSTENFVVHAKTNSQISTVSLVYNQTSNTATFQNLGSLTYRIVRSLTIPIVSSNTNKTLWWDFDLSGGQNINSSRSNQSIRNLNLDSCTSFTNVLINYTTHDEENLARLVNSTIEIDLSLFAQDYQTEISQYNRTLNQTNSVCVEIALGNSTYYLDSTAKYYNDSLGTGYSIETHNIRKRLTNSSNTPININLYDLPTAVATKFIINVKGTNFLPLAGALVDITRYYVGESLFRTIELPITDSSGQAVASLRKDDTTYTIYLSDVNGLLGTFQNIIPICINELTEECVINLNLFTTSSTPDDFYNLNDLSFSLDYDENTRDVTSLFTTSTGTPSNITLQSILYDRFGNRTICVDSLTSSSGSLLCNIPVSYDNSTVIINLFKDGEIISQKQLNLFPKAEDFLGEDRVILILLLVLTIPLMFITSLVGMVVGGILGVILSILLLLSTGGSGLGITTSVIWLIISGAIIIWKLHREGGTD